MGRLIYKRWVKTALVVLQTVLAGILAYGIMTIGFWMEDSESLKEMSGNYEETDLFFGQVETVISNKIRGKKNDGLFETDGEFDGDKEIDIQAYGTAGNSVQDMNTTYRISDLLDFVESGAQERMHEAISEALDQRGDNRQAAGEVLDAQSGELETITPVTGILLSECAMWYSDAANFVINMYDCLDEVSRDIYDRYMEYTTEQDESWSEEAPSNLRYGIVNTATGELFTNTGEADYDAAVESIQKDRDFTTLYEGERSFNIMVAMPDNVLNQEAADWFMERRFVNTNEKVYLAVNTDYPVNDELRQYADAFSRREEVVWWSLAAIIISGLLMTAGFIASMAGAGWEEGRCTPHLRSVDRIPTELAAALAMTLAVLYLLIFTEWTPSPGELFPRQRIGIALAGMSAYFLLVSSAMSFMRRLRTKTLWSNSICLMLLRTWRKVTSARAASGQLLFAYIVFVILNFVFLFLGRVGIFLMLVMDLVVLLFLLRDMTGKQSVYEGIQQISKGDLGYKIDTSDLQGETFEMAKAVNEMGDGLQEAVDAIVKNERLKAELITNVSHDIKTPLTSIVNYVDLLKRENLPGERVGHYIEVLEQKSQRLKQLTEDLVEASKISSGNIELQMVKLPFQSILQQAYGEFQERFEERRLTTVWRVEKEPVSILADGRQLWRILENLFGNIYKYALEGTRVYVELEREGETVRLTLRNTSRERLSMDAQELTGRFVRGDKSRSTEGSGLGLSIAKNLAELQNGVFELDCRNDIFQVTLCFPTAAGDGEKQIENTV